MEPNQIQGELARHVEQLLGEAFAQQSQFGEGTLDGIERTFEEVDELVASGEPPQGWDHIVQSYERCRTLFCQVLMELEILGWGALTKESLNTLHSRLSQAPAPTQDSNPSANQTAQDFEQLLNSDPLGEKAWSWEAEDPSNPPEEFLKENSIEAEMPGADDPTLIREIPRAAPDTNLWVAEEPETKTDVGMPQETWEAPESTGTFEAAEETSVVVPSEEIDLQNDDAEDFAPPPAETLAPMGISRSPEPPKAPVQPPAPDFAPPPPTMGGMDPDTVVGAIPLQKPPAPPQTPLPGVPVETILSQPPMPPAAPHVHKEALEVPATHHQETHHEVADAATTPPLMDIGELAPPAGLELHSEDDIETEPPKQTPIADLPPAEHDDVSLPEQFGGENHQDLAAFFHQLGIQGTAPFTPEAAHRYESLARIFSVEQTFATLLKGPLAHFEPHRKAIFAPLLSGIPAGIEEALQGLAQHHPDWGIDRVPMASIHNALQFLGSASSLAHFEPAILEAGVLVFFFGQTGQFGNWTAQNSLQLTGLGTEGMAELLFRCIHLQKHRNTVLRPGQTIVSSESIRESQKRLMALIHKMAPLSQVA